MSGRLIEAYTVAGFFFNEKKPAFAFDDGRHSDRGFPEGRHGFLKRPGILPARA
jgi:hypothetical protein